VPTPAKKNEDQKEERQRKERIARATGPGRDKGRLQHQGGEEEDCTRRARTSGGKKRALLPDLDEVRAGEGDTA